MVGGTPNVTQFGEGLREDAGQVDPRGDGDDSEIDLDVEVQKGLSKPALEFSFQNEGLKIINFRKFPENAIFLVDFAFFLLNYQNLTYFRNLGFDNPTQISWL